MSPVTVTFNLLTATLHHGLCTKFSLNVQLSTIHSVRRSYTRQTWPWHCGSCGTI